MADSVSAVQSPKNRKMAYLSEAKSKSLPLNEFFARFTKLKMRKSASDALKEAKRRAK